MSERLAPIQPAQRQIPGEKFRLLESTGSRAENGWKRWVTAAPALFAPLVALSPFAHDLRLTFATFALLMAITAVAARFRRFSIVVQVALWVAASASAASIWIFGAHV